MKLVLRLALASFFLFTAADAGAHDLPENRAALVLRDKGHLTLSLFIAWSDALHRALAPERPTQEFLAVYSAMNPEELQKQLRRAEAKFQSSTRLYLAAGPEVPLTNWVFPDVQRVRSLLQQRIMQAVVDPAGRTHEEPVEIHAEATVRGEIDSVRIRFPEEFQKVLVVAYRPTQLWLEPRVLSPAIRF